METREAETLLARQPAEPRTRRLGMGQHFLWLLAGIAGTAVVAAVWFSYTRQAPVPVVLEARPLTRADIESTTTTGEGVLPFQRDYLGHSRVPPPQVPLTKPAPPTPEPMETPIVTPLPITMAGAAALGSPFAQSAARAEEPKPAAQGSGQQGTPPAHGGQKPAATPKGSKLWLYARVEPNPLEGKTGPMGQAPSADPKPPQASDLIKPAHWARAADPVHVLYSTQHVEGSVRAEINSETPGDVTILVTRNVYDALGQDEVLIPQFSLMKGSYEGTTQYGQTRLSIGIRQIQFPDKTIVGLEKARLTDKSGAVGGAGEVDNHYVKLGMAVVLSTLLNVGAQSIAGNTSGYYPTTEQKVAEQLGQGVNQAGQQIVRKQLEVGPTIKIHAGEPVGVQFSDNISFSKPPTLIK